jgi:hypothetical protein
MGWWDCTLPYFAAVRSCEEYLYFQLPYLYLIAKTARRKELPKPLLLLSRNEIHAPTQRRYMPENPNRDSPFSLFKYLHLHACRYKYSNSQYKYSNSQNYLLDRVFPPLLVRVVAKDFYAVV